MCVSSSSALCALRLFPNSFTFTPSKHGNLLLRLQGNVESQAVHVESLWKGKQNRRGALCDARAALVQSQAEEGYIHLTSLSFFLPLCYYLFKSESPTAVEVLVTKLNW